MSDKQLTIAAFQSGISNAFSLLQNAMFEWPRLCNAAGIKPAGLPLYKKRLFGASVSEPFFILFKQASDRYNEKAGLMEHSIGVNVKGQLVHIIEEHVSVKTHDHRISELKSFYKSSRPLEAADAILESERAFSYIGSGLMHGNNSLNYGVPRIGTLLGVVGFEHRLKSGHVGLNDRSVPDAEVDLWVDKPLNRDESLSIIKGYMLKRLAL